VVLLFLYLLVLYYIGKEFKLCNTKEATYFIMCTLLSCCLGIIYRTYLISEGINLGLANLDMQYYVSLAESVQDMSLSDGFATISAHWNFANVNFIQIWGYRFYIYFLAFTIFKWSLLPTETAVYLVSIWQLILASYSILKLYNAVKGKLINFRYSTLIIMMVAPPVWYGCVRLLREPFMLLLIALSVCCICNKGSFWGLRLCIYLLFLLVLRSYYMVFMIPILLMIDKKIKSAFVVEGIIFIGLAVLCMARGIGPVQILGVVLSPNFFSQLKNLLFDSFAFWGNLGEIAVINFIGSIWNIIILYYAVISLLLNRHVGMISWCSVGIILDLCMTYALAFGGNTELRHKIFFVLPLIIILNNGALSQMKLPNRQTTVVISGCILLGIMLTYTLVMVSVL
jgi:hypothetical protein